MEAVAIFGNLSIILRFLFVVARAKQTQHGRRFRRRAAHGCWQLFWIEDEPYYDSTLSKAFLRVFAIISSSSLVAT